MRIKFPSGFFKSGRFLSGRCLAATLAVAVVAGCAPAPKDGSINDPFETNNRAAHQFNVGLDRALVRPASNAYGHILPEPVRMGVGNFARNLGVPSDILNDLLQGKIGDGAQNTLRFVLNTTLGIGGLFDPSTRLGLNGKPTDFGETLHVWGAREGAYLEVPVLGPTTERDLFGTVVDFATNPLRFALNQPESDIATLSQLASKVGDRYRFKTTVDSILYDSADSYAQMRLLYLQNRHHELGEKPAADPFADPYEDPYAN